MQQDDTEMYSLEMSFSGILRVYNDEGVVRGEDAPFRTYILGDTPIPLKLLEVRTRPSGHTILATHQYR